METLKLPLAQYRVHARALSTIQLPAYTGSAWRGLFGHSLKSVVCVTGKPECGGCLLYRNCVYSYVFETPPPADTTVMRKYTAAPHPFVIIPDPAQKTTVEAGEDLQVYFTVFGAGNQHVPYMLYAFEKAGERGLGSAQGQFEVTGLSQRSDLWQRVYTPGESLQLLPPLMPEVPPCPSGEVVVSFNTPLRLRLKGREIKAAELDFYALFSVLMRRISLLQSFHTDQSLELDFKALSAQAREVPVLKRELYWQDWTRYSSRQKTPVKMGGLMGQITLSGDSLQAFWPILFLGQFTHTGKGTSMGLGAFSLGFCS
ncbi:CRISPR system precrRNA processing endoribonuclease RAMP protein Cas6 [Leucothrix pacifica]|uniref:CRISPR-associated protein Cas6 n=1 Tax=Leucothrix pacifica TaxID=1247513 RepID=A0A317CJN0_9GAMM|nr:CRISPR system precrRNA processing endoribonuclease RAMP protein Cas6 [Leucothrix pacifica]PWQ97643.1 CRISPR-associated protein Cas6 [Leucothrix pacifica]